MMTEPSMATKLDELLPSAGDLHEKLALAEADEASKHARELAQEEAEKQALIDRLGKPSEVPTRRPLHQWPVVGTRVE
jgi:hypothetical protein